jgi:hypothetical protein
MVLNVASTHIGHFAVGGTYYNLLLMNALPNTKAVFQLLTMVHAVLPRDRTDSTWIHLASNTGKLLTPTNDWSTQLVYGCPTIKLVNYLEDPPGGFVYYQSCHMVGRREPFVRNYFESTHAEGLQDGAGCILKMQAVMKGWDYPKCMRLI